MNKHVCPTCKGSGIAPAAQPGANRIEDCSACHGSGQEQDKPVRACDPPKLAVLVEGVGEVEIPFSKQTRQWYVCLSSGTTWLSERPTDHTIGKVRVPHNSVVVHPSQVTHL